MSSRSNHETRAARATHSGAETVHLVSGVIVIAQEQVIAHSPELARLFPALLQTRPATSELPPILNDILASAQKSHEPVRQEIAVPARGTVVELNAISLVAGAISRMIISVAERSTTSPNLDALRRLDRLASLGTLSASMAHEVRNAFVAVKTFIDLLIEQDPDTELAGLVHREMRRIDSLVAQMLRFAAPVVPDRRIISLHTTLEHTLQMVQPNLKARSIKLTKIFAAQPDTLTGDDHQLEQAVLNLLINAMEAMGSTGELTLITAEIPAQDPRSAATPFAGQATLQLQIIDTGPGIPLDAQRQLFEPFFTTKPSGTGLGLAITRRIIKEHGGHISLSSQPGQGCTFALWFPISPTV